MFSRPPSTLSAHTPRAHGPSRATYLCVSLVADSASDFAGAAVTRVRPRHALALPGFFQPSAPGTLGNLGALVLRDHPLHLGQEFALWTIPERMLEKDQRRGHLLELLDQEPLMRIIPGQPIRR